MASQHVYLITGANRGIGHAVLTQLVARDNVLVIAAVRDPSSTSVSGLAQVPLGHNSRIVVVKVDSASETDALEAVQQLQTQYGVDRLDVVIANAGISTDYGPVVAVKADHIRKQVDVNAIGPLYLFQATLPLLEKAATPKFVLIGSAAGSIAGIEKRPVPMSAYGASKAIAHFLVRKIHAEHERVVSFAVEPGFVQSELGNAGARKFGMPEAPVPLADSAKFIVSQVDGATKESLSGKFPTIEGGFFEW